MTRLSWVMVLLVVLTSCTVRVSPPLMIQAAPKVVSSAPASHVEIDWGSGLVPDRADVHYGGHRGCRRPSGGTGTGCEDSSQTLDIYYPVSGGSKGTIVFFHGGGFFSGDKAELGAIGPVMKQLTNGYAIASVNYRLSDPSLAGWGVRWGGWGVGIVVLGGFWG